MTPRTTWGWTEPAYTPKDKPLQTQKGTAGSYTRDETDWDARNLGLTTLKEAKGKALTYPGEQKMKRRSERLKKSSALIIDTILTGEDPHPRSSALIKELVKDKYSSAEIRESLKNQLKSKVTEQDIRLMGKGTSTRQKLLIQYWNSLR